MLKSHWKMIAPHLKAMSKNTKFNIWAMTLAPKNLVRNFEYVVTRGDLGKMIIYAQGWESEKV